MADEVLDQQIRVGARERTDGEDGGVGTPPSPSRRRSKISDRAVHTTSKGVSRSQSAIVSSRSSKVGSAQWMSSTISTTGPCGRQSLEEPADRPRRFPLRQRRVGDPEDLRQGVDDTLPVLGLRQSCEGFRRTVAASSPSRISAASRTTSAIGQYVIASP